MKLAWDNFYDTNIKKTLGLKIPKIYRYTGAELDNEIGLSYQGNRYLVTTLGVWISSDPLSIETGVNLYCYAACGPIMRNNQNGQQDVDIGEDP